MYCLFVALRLGPYPVLGLLGSALAPPRAAVAPPDVNKVFVCMGILGGSQ
jgi:hypothetical protein